MWNIGAFQLSLLAAAAVANTVSATRLFTPRFKNKLNRVVQATSTAAGTQAASHGQIGAQQIPSRGVPLLHVSWQSDSLVSSGEFRQRLEQACRGSAGHRLLACEATETPKVYCSLFRQLRQRNHSTPESHGKAVVAATPVKPPDTAGNVSNSTAPEVTVAVGSPFTACLRFDVDVGSPDEKTPFVQCLEQAAEEDGCSNGGNSFPRDVSISGTEDQERSGETVHDDARTKLEDNSTRSMLPRRQMPHTEPYRLLLAAQTLREQLHGNNANAQLPKWWNGGNNSNLTKGPPESVSAAKALHAAAAVAVAIGNGQASTEAMTASDAATAALATSHAAASASFKALSMAKGAVAEVSKLREHLKKVAEAKAAALRKLEGDAQGLFG